MPNTYSKHVGIVNPRLRCRANMAKIRQSRPDSGLSIQESVPRPFRGVPSLLGSGTPRRRTCTSHVRLRYISGLSHMDYTMTQGGRERDRMKESAREGERMKAEERERARGRENGRDRERENGRDRERERERENERERARECKRGWERERARVPNADTRHLGAVHLRLRKSIGCYTGRGRAEEREIERERASESER